jgi:hypothetical protein
MVKPKAKREHFEQLRLVVTLAEAARIVHRDRCSVSYALDAGHIAHRRVGRIVLVSVPSLFSYYKISL